jgi:hypothetical protein
VRVGELQTFEWRMNLLDFGPVPFSRRLILRFIVKGSSLQGTKCREGERKREFLAPSIGVINPVSRSLRTATVHVLSRSGHLVLPLVSYFASRRRRPALISAVWQSRSILNITLRHSAMVEACPPHRDDVVVSRPLIRTVR